MTLRRSAPSLGRSIIGPIVMMLAALVLVAACSDGDSEDTGAAGTDATAEEEEAELMAEGVFDQGSTSMATIENARFVLEQVGAPVPIDEQGQLLFQAAEGRIVLPASAEAVVTVEALGFDTEVGAIAIDGTVWFTNPLTGDWTEAPPGFAFDPAALFDPAEGFAALLAEAAPTARFVDEADQDPADDPPEADGPFHRIQADISAERVEVLTSGLVAEPTTIDTWIDTDSSRLIQARFELPIGDEVSQWRLVLTEYDAVEGSIEPPELAGAGS